MKSTRPQISSGDYDKVILDMLDDIVKAERQATRLIDRVDAITKKPSLRVVDLNSYLWAVAAITIVAFMLGAIFGYLVH